MATRFTQLDVMRSFAFQLGAESSALDWLLYAGIHTGRMKGLGTIRSQRWFLQSVATASQQKAPPGGAGLFA